MSETAPTPGETWQHNRSGRRVVIGEQPEYGRKNDPRPDLVFYKAVRNPNGGHTALAKMPREKFLKEYWLAVLAEEPPTIYRPESDTYEPAAMVTDLNTALAAIAADLHVRARSLLANNNELDEVRASTLFEVANAITEYVDGRTIDRALFLSWSVVSLLVNLKLTADASIARSMIIDGLVYIDGEQVTDSDAPITRVARDRFAIRCGDLSKIVKVVG